MGSLGSHRNRERPPAEVLLIGAAGAFIFFFFLAGCARPEPYVYKATEFDRRSFAQTASVPGLIQICYSANATTSDAVVRLAEKECAKFGKTPQMIGQDISTCPMATPITANYLCCPSVVDPILRYRCSAAGGRVDRLDNDQVREALAAERRKPSR